MFTSSKIEEVESAPCTLFEVASWMDWWLYAARAMVLERCTDEAKCYSLFVVGECTHMMVVCISPILWAKRLLTLCG